MGLQRPKQKLVPRQPGDVPTCARRAYLRKPEFPAKGW